MSIKGASSHRRAKEVDHYLIEDSDSNAAGENGSGKSLTLANEAESYAKTVEDALKVGRLSR